MVLSKELRVDDRPDHDGEKDDEQRRKVDTARRWIWTPFEVVG